MRSARSLKIGTGPSRLDLLNGESVGKVLERFASGMKIQPCSIPDRREHGFSQKGRGEHAGPSALQKALIEKKIDVALSSMREVSHEMPKELQIGAVTKRLTPFDALLCLKNQILDELAAEARIATSSLRVKAQLLHYRPDLEIVWTDAEVEAQMKRVTADVFEAVVISAADAENLGWQDRITEVFTTSLCLPAVGQGSLCLQVRRSDRETLKLAKHLDDSVSRAEINAERSFLRALGEAAWLPCGALGRTNGNDLVVEAFVASPDGKHLFKDVESGTLGEEEEIGTRLAERILEEGGRSILSTLGVL